MTNKQFYIAAALTFATMTAAAQPQCKIISFDHFGGNGTEVIDRYAGYDIEPDGSFKLHIGTNSTESSSMLTGCAIPIIGGGVFRRYNADYTALLDQRCIPQGTDFRWPTHLVFPQEGGDTILIGQSELSSGDFGIERRNTLGEVVWSKHYGGSSSEGLTRAKKCGDGGFLMIGETLSDDGDVGLDYDGSFGFNGWVLKTDNNGDKLWARVLGSSGEDRISDVIPAADGGCLVIGSTVGTDHDAEGNHGNLDLFAVRLDVDGNTMWHRCYGGSGIDGTWDIKGDRAMEDGSGGYYIASGTASSDGDVATRAPDLDDFWLIHIDSGGDILWENTYGGPNSQWLHVFCRGADGSFWLGGETWGSGGQVAPLYSSEDGWVAHADSLGNFINSRTIGADKTDRIILLAPLPDNSVLAGGHYYITATSSPGTPGFPETSEGDYDIFLARLSPENDLSAQTVTMPDDDWQLYPNPAESMATVRLTIPTATPYSLVVFNLGGRRVFEGRLTTEITIPTAAWSKGIYNIQLTDTKGRSGSKKLTKI